MDQTIVLTDTRAPFVHAFDAKTGERLRSFGDNGEGPGDFSTGPSPLRYGSSGDTLWLADPPQRRITAFRLGVLDASAAGNVVVTLPIPGVRTVALDGPVGGRFFGLASDPQLGLVPFVLDSASDPAVRILPPVHDGDSSASARYLAQAYAARVCISPDGRRMVIAYSFAGRIDLRNLGGESSDSVRVPFPFRPAIAFDTLTREMAFFSAGDSVRRGYADCAATTGGFYALYLGFVNGPGPRGPRPHSELHVFDWSGALRRVAVLDHAATTMAIPVGDSVLYTAWEGPEGAEIRRVRLQ